jgi:glycosyltransferase involved in cell wall biosynthesis
LLRSLYICYLGTSDPLVETQVIAYLRGLSRAGNRVHLLTYETKPRDMSREAELEVKLKEEGIIWERLTYHKSPTLLATIYDVIRGVIRGLKLIRRHRIEVVHARVHVPAAMGLILGRLMGSGLIFDIRGLIAEESVETGRWKKGGLPERLTKWVERRAIARADGAVVLTGAAKQLLFDNRDPSPVRVIPCCVDFDRFENQRNGRCEMRRSLGLEERTVIAYVGKFTGWYMEREMVEFFAAAREEIDDLHFLILTQSKPGLIVAEFERLGIPREHYTVTKVAPEQMGRALSAADFGISFIRPTFSKLASSPTKLGEYLAAGLPVVTTRGVGGVDEVLGDGSGIGVFVERHSPESYRSAAREIRGLLDQEATRARCIETARTQLSLQQRGIPEYVSLYRGVASPDKVAR